jgi:hypothetical protein
MFTLDHIATLRICQAALVWSRGGHVVDGDSPPPSEITKVIVPILVGVALVLCIWLFRKGIQRFFRLLFTFILNVLFGVFLFSAILLAGYLIDDYAASRASGPSVHILQYAASALFVLSVLSGTVIVIRAVWRFAQGLFSRGVSP